MDTIIIAAVFVIYLGGHGGHRNEVLQQRRRHVGIYPGREKASAHCCGHVAAQASDMSGWLLTGLPGLAYILYAGTSEAIWTAGWTGIGNISQLALRRQEAEKVYSGGGERITLPDLFENRFRDKKHIPQDVSEYLL